MELDGAEIKGRILRVAAELFHKQGVRFTSPGEIIKAAGTRKGQFYHYFKNKEGLVHEVLLTHLEMIKTGQSPVSYDVNSWEELRDCLLIHIELQKRFDMTRGCPIGTVGNEVTERDELIRQDVNLIFQVIKNKLASFFIREKAKGNLREDADEERLADFCLATLQGAMMIGKVQRSPQPVETTIRETLKHIERYLVNNGPLDKPPASSGSKPRSAAKQRIKQTKS